MNLWKSTLSYTALLLTLSGCVASGPSPKDKATIDTTLPVVTLTEHGKFVDMEAIGFEWKSVSDPRVEGIDVYKLTQTQDSKNELKHYTTIKDRFSTHFVDSDISPNTKYSYAFKTFSKDAQGRRSPVISVSSLPILTSVSWIYSQTGMPRTAKIIWRPHENESVKSYIIERKTLEENEWDELATVDGRLNAEYIDKDLKDNYVYQYRIRVKTYAGIVSQASKVVKVVTKALPTTVTNIQASVNLPKKIKIIWDKTNVQDFQFYYVYRSSRIDGNYELIATLHNPLFEDKIEKDGVSYFYRVSVVDKDGLESEHEKVSIQGMSLPKPTPPAVINANMVDNHVEIMWSQVDPRTASYIVVKKQKKGWFDKSEEEFTDIKSKKFIDTNIVDGSTYSYSVYAVDKFGLKSEPSIEINFTTKEPTEAIEASVVEPEKEVQVSKVIDAAPSQEIVSPVSDIDVSEF